MIYFTFRDADDRRGELEKVDAASEMLVLKAGVLPGAYGYSDLHVTHLRYLIGSEEILIICVTDYAMSDEVSATVIARVHAALRPENSKGGS